MIGIKGGALFECEARKLGNVGRSIARRVCGIINFAMIGFWGTYGPPYREVYEARADTLRD